MKILLLNPNIDAEHDISRSLQDRGVALLVLGNPEEAWQLIQLHENSLDLAVIHREGTSKGPIPPKKTSSSSFPIPPNSDDTPGLQLIQRLKADPAFVDLPVILTTSEWGDAECAAHQETPNGVNAYLSSPFRTEQLIEMIEAVLGKSVGKIQIPVPPAHPSPPMGEPQGVVLEEVTDVLASGTHEPTGLSIQLEAPEFESQSEPTAESVPKPLSESLPELKTELAAESQSEPESKSGEISVPLSFGEVKSEEVSSESPSLTLDPSLAFEYPSGPASEKQPLGSDGERVESSKDDLEIAQEMPYLFKESLSKESLGAENKADSSRLFAEPIGDAVVPGGAAHSPDLDTIKKYLLLREQDVAALSHQLKTAKEQIAMQEKLNREERAKNVDLTHLVNEQKRKLDEFEKVKKADIDSLQSEITELNFQMRARTDKARALESRVRESTEQMEQLKERVRLDIRKIRVREKELENRLEITKKDSEALIAAREGKIIELKRKVDLLEFNMDLLQEQYSREKEVSLKLREKLEKAAQVVRVAGGLLDSSQGDLPRSEADQDRSGSDVVSPGRSSGDNRKIS